MLIMLNIYEDDTKIILCSAPSSCIDHIVVIWRKFVANEWTFQGTELELKKNHYKQIEEESYTRWGESAVAALYNSSSTT